MVRYPIMLVLSRLVYHAPRWLAYGLAAAIAELAFVVNRPARRVVLANIRHALGPRATPARVRAAARGCFRSAAYYFTELARTPRMDPARFFHEKLQCYGFERIEEAVAAGRGVIIATIHYGNPEYVAQCMGARGYTFFALTEPLEPKPLAELFQRLRASQGHTFIPVGRGAVKAAIRHVRRGGVLCIMADRDIQHAGEEVPFLGAPARIPTGAVELARHTGAVVLPSITRRVGWDRFELYVQPPLALVNTGRPVEDQRTNTARLIQRFENYMRQDPSQWFVLEESIWPEPGCRPRSVPDTRRRVAG